jgi:hypothetical protein
MLAACDVPNTLPDAATVLAQAQTAKITDLSFTATGTFASSLGAVLGGGSDGSNFSFQADVSGKITMSPQRADLAFSLGQGQGVALEIITDAATHNGYVRVPALAQAGLGTGQWIQVPLDGLATYLDTSIFSNFEHIAKATMVGPDTISGVAVYHLRGTQQLQQGVGGATEDFYVRKDNSFPVRVVIHGSVSVPTQATGGTGGGSAPAATVDVTTNFTGVNTGIAIALPPASQVAGA